LTAKQARTTRPLRSGPITGPSALLRDGPPLCPAPVLSPSQFPLLGDLPCATDRRPRQRHWPGRPVGATGSHVPCKSPSQARATSTPDAIWAVGRHPQTHPGAPKHPRFRRHLCLSTRHQWFALARLLGSHLPRSRRDFPPTLTTTALDRSSSRWFAASACTAAAEGHQANNTPAPPSPAQHRIQRPGSSTSSLLQRSWHTMGRPALARRGRGETAAFVRGTRASAAGTTGRSGLRLMRASGIGWVASQSSSETPPEPLITPAWDEW
jgi:hypothetical protein